MSDKGYRPPFFTMIPNILLDDDLPEMKEAELRVSLAICRKTFGWGKKEDVISLSQLEQLTGLSRQGVINGVSDGIERGTIRRVKRGQSFAYTVIIDESASQLSRPVGTAASQLSRPVEAQTGQPSRPTKESTKESPKGTMVPFQVFLIWCEVLGYEPTQITKTKKGQECRYAKELLDAGWGKEDIGECLEHLNQHDFWGKQSLSLAHVAKEINKWKRNQGSSRVLKI